EHLVAAARQLMHPDREHGDAILVALDFLGHADDHEKLRSITGQAQKSSSLTLSPLPISRATATVGDGCNPDTIRIIAVEDDVRKTLQAICAIRCISIDSRKLRVLSNCVGG